MTRTAFTFPGQGSHSVGMGRDLADSFPEAAAVFAEVDDALDQKLSAIIFEGPADELTLTANAQPALMAVSIAVMRVFEARGLDLRDSVTFVAGHSLGEYSALCAAGSLSLSDTARLLRIRGNAMQHAVPVGKGAMAAILGLDVGAVEALCLQIAEAHAGERDAVVQIANDNGGGQIVISGGHDLVDKVSALALENGAKRAVPLPVSAPFHCALMAPAADAMREALGDVVLQAPAVPLVANVVAAPIVDPAEIVDLLVEQVTGRVRWRESVEYMRGQDVSRHFEIGAGKVLCGLARRMDRTIQCIAVSGATDIDLAMAALEKT